MASKAWTIGGAAAAVIAIGGLLVALTGTSDHAQEFIHSARKTLEALGVVARSAEIVGPTEQLNDRAGANVKYPSVREPDPEKKIVTARLDIYDEFPGSQHTASPVKINDEGTEASATVATVVRNDGKNCAFKARIIADVVTR